MRTLLLCAIVAVCVCGTLGARRRLLNGGPPRRVVQRPFGGPRFRNGEREDYRRGPQPGRTPPSQLRLAPRQPFSQAPPPQQFDQQFREPFRQEPQESYRQEPREPFTREPQEPLRREPQDPFRQESEQPFRQEPQEILRKEPLEAFRQEPQEPFRQESLEPFRLDTQKEFAQENAAPEENPSPVKRAPAAEEREEYAAAESVVQKRQDFAAPAEQRQAPSFSEPELAADSRQDDYSLNIPEKQEKQRLEFQVHGQQGPHSYRFGYDTGSGYNRQFRFEERDADGNLNGRYGYYNNGKLQVVNYSATHKGGFHAEGDFGKFPEKSH